VGLGQRPNPGYGGTARRILEHARRAFNERGVAAVGIRDIARELRLSPGNVSYHFATKEALVAALIEEAHGENEALFSRAAGPLDFAGLDVAIRAIMRRDLENRWVMRDCVGLLATLPALRPLHETMQRAREARADGIVARLVDAGLIEPGADRALLREQLLTQVFFWLPAAIVAAPGRDPAERLDVHARAALALFRADCTRAGRRALEAVLGSAAGPRADERRAPATRRARPARSSRRPKRR